jgi:hypothetical protein
MKFLSITLLSMCLMFLGSCTQTIPDSLVPDVPSKAPDYFCTWNIQGYVVSYQYNKDIRAAINERNIFGTGEYEHWIEFFPAIRGDLYFLMDDSWDIPQDVNTKDNEYLGTVELDTTRFPSYKGLPEERLKKLVADIESRGWKGVGGWICAQEAPKYGVVDRNSYWIERLKAAHTAGFDYWKVDWGKQDNSEAWRRMLTTLGKEYAPELLIEHALPKKFIQFSDVFRTYDVESVTSQTETIQRIAGLLAFHAENGVKGIINCEDEPYIAAGLGCAIGIERHPFNGKLPDGMQDFCFPPVGRDLKNRLDEIVRSVRWHRIAEPFGVGTTTYETDPVQLSDYWILGERETWMLSRHVGDTIFATAPARVSRGLPLPEVTNLHGKNQPVVLASRYLNGAIAITTVGRSLGREYVMSRETVTVELPEITVPVGIFGDYKELVLVVPQKIDPKGVSVYGQDLAGDTPVNITGRVKAENNTLIIPGDIIREVGLMAATKGDVSDPGMVLKIVEKSIK